MVTTPNPFRKTFEVNLKDGIFYNTPSGKRKKLVLVSNWKISIISLDLPVRYNGEDDKESYLQMTATHGTCTSLGVE